MESPSPCNEPSFSTSLDGCSNEGAVAPSPIEKATMLKEVSCPEGATSHG